MKWFAAHTTDSSSNSFVLYFISASLGSGWRRLWGTIPLGIVVLIPLQVPCGLRHISDVFYDVCRNVFFSVIFEISAFILSKAVVCVSSQRILLFVMFSFFRRGLMGLSKLAKLGINLMSWCIESP